MFAVTSIVWIKKYTNKIVRKIFFRSPMLGPSHRKDRRMLVRHRRVLPLRQLTNKLRVVASVKQLLTVRGLTAGLTKKTKCHVFSVWGPVMTGATPSAC